jgi:hypothetical protein
MEFLLKQFLLKTKKSPKLKKSIIWKVNTKKKKLKIKMKLKIFILIYYIFIQNLIKRFK